MARISTDRKFEFGKYEGWYVSDVINTDPRYIEYLITKIKWIFTDKEIQTLRNLRNRQKNKDIISSNVPSRTKFENEMYNLYSKMRRLKY